MLAWDAREEAARNLEQGGFEAHEMAESVLERVATRKIREAIEQGCFDNLPGHGKPLDNYELGTDGGLGKVLKNANVLPKWIEEGKQVRQKIQIFRDSAIETRTRTELNRLNAQIRSFNLICRVPTMSIPLLHPDQELSTCTD